MDPTSDPTDGHPRGSFAGRRTGSRAYFVAKTRFKGPLGQDSAARAAPGTTWSLHRMLSTTAGSGEVDLGILSISRFDHVLLTSSSFPS